MFRYLLILTSIFTSTVIAQLSDSGTDSAPARSSSPFFDPSNETITFLGKTFTLKDTRIGLHFESYLTSQEYQSDSAQEYIRTLNEIKNTLHPSNTSQNKILTAHGLLRSAANYKGDHNVSESLASAVTSVLAALDIIEKRELKNKQLNKEKAKLIRKLEFVKTRTPLHLRKKSEQKKAKKRKKTAEHLAVLRKIAEIELLKKKNKGVGELQLATLKIHFQSLLVQFFMQRRFEHVVIGCRFYVNLFRPTDASVTLKEGSLVSQFFSDSAGVSPTISGLEAFAEEAIFKVKTLVHISEKHLKRGELHAASNRLLEAFAVGEHLTFIHQLPLQKKKPLYQYSHISNNLMDAIESRDFITAKAMNQQLKSIAKDYRYSRAESYINTFTQASNTHVIQAFIQMNKENEKNMFSEIENAKELWPNNPKIDDFYKVLNSEFQQALDQQSTYKQSVKRFDSLLKNQAYLTILEKKNWSTFATHFNIKNDTSRLESLNEIEEKYKPALIGLKTCQALAQANHHIAAWEACQELSEKHPNLTEIQQALLDYRTKASSFVKLIEHARAHQKNRHFGSALTYYLKAKTLHPKSTLAEQGINIVLSNR